MALSFAKVLLLMYIVIDRIDVTDAVKETGSPLIHQESSGASSSWRPGKGFPDLSSFVFWKQIGANRSNSQQLEQSEQIPKTTYQGTIW